MCMYLENHIYRALRVNLWELDTTHCALSTLIFYLLIWYFVVFSLYIDAGIANAIASFK